MKVLGTLALSCLLVPLAPAETRPSDARFVVRSVVPPAAGDGQQVRMTERADRPRLQLEAAQALGVRGGVFGQDLDRDVAAEAGIARAVDFAHTSRSEGREDLVRPEAGARRQRHGETLSLLRGPRPALETVAPAFQRNREGRDVYGRTGRPSQSGSSWAFGSGRKKLAAKPTA